MLLLAGAFISAGSPGSRRLLRSSYLPVDAARQQTPIVLISR